MLNFQELANELIACADGQISVEDFEEWFDQNSWNVHQQQEQNLIDMVFRVEALFSAYAGGRLDRQGLLREFRGVVNSIRPLANQPLFDQPSAKNSNCESQYTPIPGTSTSNAFNVAV
jgi:hypothetical protein